MLFASTWDDVYSGLGPLNRFSLENPQAYLEGDELAICLRIFSGGTNEIFMPIILLILHPYNEAFEFTN